RVRNAALAGTVRHGAERLVSVPRSPWPWVWATIGLCLVGGRVMLTTILLAATFFGICFALLGIGFLVRGMVLKGSCGGAAAVLGEESCGACGKKERDMCPSEDGTGLLDLSQISNPHKTIQEREERLG